MWNKGMGVSAEHSANALCEQHYEVMWPQKLWYMNLSTVVCQNPNLYKIYGLVKCSVFGVHWESTAHSMCLLL